jgi:hypothetical protein
MFELIPKTESTALTVVSEEYDNRSLPEILQDVHLTNLGQKRRTFDEQVVDRIYLQDCIACWDLAKVFPPIRAKVEKVLMEKYWLIGDEVRMKKKPLKEETEYQIKALPVQERKLLENRMRESPRLL